MTNSGSEWRKWNFHVHTKGTNKNDQFSSTTMDDFFCKFFKKAIENQISSIGITDYFSIDRYIDALNYQRDIENKKDVEGKPLFNDQEITYIKGIFLFPNVELRMIPVTDRGKLINVHCLFNPDYVENLEHDFFGHIENQDRHKMTRYGITQYGKNLDSTILEEFKQYEKGLDNFVISLDSLKERLESNKNFRENTILVVSNSSNDGASAIQKHYDLFEGEAGSLDGLRKSLYLISDAIFSGNPKDVKYFLGKRLEGTDDYDDEKYRNEVSKVISERGSLKACIVGCDAHKEEDLFTRFTWVKSNLNFEGLRQICFEPEQRVRLQEEMPDYKEDKLVIEKVNFISPNNVFSTTPIYLNPNLNVIIGGKSSGKSILLYSIAKTLLTDDSLLKNEDGHYKYQLNEIDSSFDFEITTKGGFNQKLNRDSNQNSILPEIKYIPQNYLVKLAEPAVNKTGKPLNNLVRELIIEDEESRTMYQSFVEKVKQNDKIRNAEIDNFFDLKNELKVLEEELKTKSNVEVLQKNIDTNSLKLENLNKNTGLSEEQVIEYKLLQNKVEKNKERLQKFREDFSAVETFNQDLLHNLKMLNQKKISLIDNLQIDEIRDYCSEAYKSLEDLLSEASKISKSLEIEINSEGKRTFKEDGKFKEVLVTIHNEQIALKSEIKPFENDDEIKKSIATVSESLVNDRKALSDIDNLSKKIKDKKEQLQNSKLEILAIYENSHKEYLAIIESLKVRTDELEKDGLGIVGKANFHYSKLRKTLIDMSDGRSASYRKFSVFTDDIKSIDDMNFESLKSQLKEIFEELIDGKYILNNRVSVLNAVKALFDDHFFDFWEITYKGDKLGEMSTGKASFVILMLIIGLSKSKAPILIDQPEDNLDNRSITSDLVSYLRNKKLERQIIVVTHNANIVVNADAENIIVANQKGQNDDCSTSQFKFDYINGAIEDSFDKNSDETDLLKSMGIRQHIAEVVEGGKEAFISREKKYRFK